MAKKRTRLKTESSGTSPGKRTGRISQNDLPRHSISESLRLAQSLWDDFAGGSAQPHQLAMSVDVSPTSSLWRSLSGSSIGYGLTEGGYNSDAISLTPLGRRIVAPEEDGDDTRARAESVIRPKIIGDFFCKYNKAKFPSDKIAQNVLVGMGVPQERVATVLEMIKHNGDIAGIIHQTKTGPFVAVDDPKPTIGSDEDEIDEAILTDTDITPGPAKDQRATGDADRATTQVLRANNRVYISHGKDRLITKQIKEILTFGKFEPVVSVEKESTAIPVPEKVFEDMRSCAAAVIHVMSEGEFLDPNGKKVNKLNENVLIEIGAAIAICKKNVVLLVEKGTQLPSNLQGLYLCEYEGDVLDHLATMKLLKTFNEFQVS